MNRWNRQGEQEEKNWAKRRLTSLGSNQEENHGGAETRSTAWFTALLADDSGGSGHTHCHGNPTTIVDVCYALAFQALSDYLKNHQIGVHCMVSIKDQEKNKDILLLAKDIRPLRIYTSILKLPTIEMNCIRSIQIIIAHTRGSRKTPALNIKERVNQMQSLDSGKFRPKFLNYGDDSCKIRKLMTK
ncbi:uncharacterized protein G2W53_003586 [Senna tora]|uniref:Uncharacterized protein n=1 Tax=Senna tora TaxID=362788 RepID=A0A834XDT7_9FABA|nr:uncharacterized protein G2W53_003586 [Senna tora]